MLTQLESFFYEAWARFSYHAKGGINILPYSLLSVKVFDNEDDLQHALNNNDINNVIRLLKIPSIKIYAHAFDNLALRWAAENGHLAVVRELLKIDAVRNNAAADNNYALRRAARNGHIAVAQELLKIDEVATALRQNIDDFFNAIPQISPLISYEIIKTTHSNSLPYGISENLKQHMRTLLNGDGSTVMTQTAVDYKSFKLHMDTTPENQDLLVESLYRIMPIDGEIHRNICAYLGLNIP